MLKRLKCPEGEQGARKGNSLPKSLKRSGYRKGAHRPRSIKGGP